MIGSNPGGHHMDHTLVLLAQAVINQQFVRGDLNLALVAAQLGVSRWRLSRAFSGCRAPFRSRVRRVRMLEAGRRLCDEQTISIKEVAIDVGYRYHSDFTRHFKAHWGVTPTAFREHHRTIAANQDCSMVHASNE